MRDRQHYPEDRPLTSKKVLLKKTVLRQSYRRTRLDRDLAKSYYRMKESEISLDYEKILEHHKRLYAAVEARDMERATASAHSYLHEIDSKIEVGFRKYPPA